MRSGGPRPHCQRSPRPKPLLGGLPPMGLFSAGVWVEEFGDLSTALRPHTPLLQPHGQGNCVPNTLIFWEPYWSGWMVAPKDDPTQIPRV